MQAPARGARVLTLMYPQTPFTFWRSCQMWQMMAVACERVHAYQNLTQRPDKDIVLTLAAVGAKYGKNYCIPSQDKLIELLARHQHRRMCRRTLNRHLNALERDGMIKRTRRHCADQRDPRRGMVFRSTLYELTRRAFRWLASNAPAVARAVKWGASKLGNSRVTNLSQYI